ncbi:ROK family protein [soil metagenome]
MVEALQEQGPLSRSQAARVVGLSKPTVSAVFNELIDAGLLRDVGSTRGSQGPRASLYEVNNDATWVVGIDVGRRWVRAAVANLSGEIVARVDEPARLRSDRTLLDQTGSIARKVLVEPGLTWSQVSQVAVGSPGVVDPERKLMMMTANLPGWERLGMVDAIRAEFEGNEVHIENDVNLAALGELWKGHGRGCDNFAYLWIGSGVGLGLVIHGQLYRGARGLAGEIGNLPIGLPDSHVEPHVETPDRPWRGWYDSSTVTAAIERLAEARNEGPLNLQGVFALARKGDALAREVVELEARLLARAVAAVTGVMDPEMVILGGGVGHNGDLLLQPIERELRLLSPLSTKLLNSALGADAVLHGAVGTAISAAWDSFLAAVGTEAEGAVIEG